MTIPDPIKLLVQTIAADSAVIALASTRVYGGGIHEKDMVGMPQYAVVVSPSGGAGRAGFNLWRRNRVDVTCYGTDLVESWRLYIAVREVLENLGRSGPLIAVECSSDGANALDPVTLWPTCYASFTVTSTVAV